MVRAFPFLSSIVKYCQRKKLFCSKIRASHLKVDRGFKQVRLLVRMLCEHLKLRKGN